MKWHKEPLIHFLALGAVIFGLDAWLGRDRNAGTPAPRDLVVLAATVEELTEHFQRFWRRPPTAEELDSLVGEHVLDEVLYREAVALGFDRDDPLIRRRLRQKMEVLFEASAPTRQPSDEDLQRHLAEHPDAFAIEPRYDLTQVFLDPDLRGNRLASDAEALRLRLNAHPTDQDPAAQGDPPKLASRLLDYATSDVSRLLGPAFAASLETAEPGVWLAPVTSGYGLHLVRVDARTPGRMPDLDEVRPAVRRAWLTQQRRRAEDEFHNTLLARYRVVVESSAQQSPDANPPTPATP